MPDREKVIRGLEEFKADLKPFAGNKADWQKVDNALDLLKAQEQNAGKWISVRDRLPEEGIAVLVWEKQGFAYVDEIRDGKWGLTNLLTRNTHWMPLPEPPKEGT